MLIGIDASRANKKFKTGVEWYSYHLIEELKKIDRINHYFLYTNKPLSAPLNICPENFEERLLKWPLPRLWTLGRLSLEMAFSRNKPDVLFVPAHTLPFAKPRRAVVTIHDIGFEHCPRLYKWPDKIYHRQTIKWIKRLADKIITVSEFSKKDLIEKYDIDAQKIAVVYNGYDDGLFRPLENLTRLAPFPYFLFIGRLEAKKNVARLVEAFKIFKEKNSLAPEKLVLIGKPGFGFERVQDNIRRWNLGDEVKLLGWVEEPALPVWLSAATAFVFPSLFEGFGLPVIEAMACGCPVVCSNSTSLPEIAAGAAMYFNPESSEDIAEKLQLIRADDRLRLELRAAGLARAKNFSWRKCAEETLAVLTGVNG